MPKAPPRSQRGPRGMPPAVTSPTAQRVFRNNRRRAVALTSVYLLMGLHVAHWRLTGRTLAPLELNEVMVTLELGIVTAGFLFMLTATISVLIFGRFFCSWGCHILALEDLSAWLLGRIGIHPRPVRSRLLLVVPPAALFYMFIWPQVSRVASGQPLPDWRLATDSERWASFVTSDFWRNLPGPGITALTFVVVGFLAVYVLGSRSFCRHCCPYGAAFALADRLAPGRISLTGDCTGCAKCTAACTSDIRVHEELAAHGRVVHPGCLKDLDCVSVCPEDAIGFRFTRPAGFLSWKGIREKGYRWNLSWAEELLAALSFVVVLASMRGLYDSVPFLLSIALGAVAATMAVVAVRLGRARDVPMAGTMLKRAGSITRAGRLFVVLTLLLIPALAHCMVIRYHEFLGKRALASVHREPGAAAVRTPEIARAIDHLEVCRRWGLVRSPHLLERLGRAHLLAGEPARAESYLRDLCQRMPGAGQPRLLLAQALADRGQATAALAQLSGLLVWKDPDSCPDPATRELASRAHDLAARMHIAAGDPSSACQAFRHALVLQPGNLMASLALAELLAQSGDLESAVTELRLAVTHHPGHAPACYNLAVILHHQRELNEARVFYEKALASTPRDPETLNNLAVLLIEIEEPAQAEHLLRAAIQWHPEYPHPYYHLARLLQARGDLAAADECLQTAARLDPSYRELLLPSPSP